jgi:hypothetical protein
MPRTWLDKRLVANDKFFVYDEAINTIGIASKGGHATLDI